MDGARVGGRVGANTGAGAGAGGGAAVARIGSGPRGVFGTLSLVASAKWTEFGGASTIALP